MPPLNVMTYVDHLDPLPHQVPNARYRYSLGRMFQRAAKSKGDPGWGLDGFEGEVSKELEKRYGKPKRGGIWVPWDAPVQLRSGLSLTTGVGALSTVRADYLIDVLRSKSVLSAMGGSVIDVGRGNFSVPKKTATVTVGWYDENLSPGSEFHPTIDQAIVYKPNSVMAYCDFSRATVSQIGNAESMVVNDLVSAIAHEVDRVGVNGAGTGVEPVGVVANSAVPVYPLGANGGAPTRAMALAMEKTLGNANADVGSVGWVTSPNGRAAMRNVETSAGSGRYLWSDKDRVLSYPAFATNQVPSNLAKGTGTNLSPLIIGNWSDLLVGLFGPVELLVDHITFSNSGGIRLCAFQSADVHLRHAESFVKAIDMVTS